LKSRAWFLACVLALLVVGAHASAQGGTAGPTAVVTIYHFGYHPQTLVVRPGTLVRFVNHDRVAHVTSAASFGSKYVDYGQSWSHRFLKPGVYHYTCGLHPYMAGTIVVKRQVP
jgi:plastocyanin